MFYRIVHDSRADESEVRIIGEVASPEPSFIPKGHSTILHSTDKKMRPLFITTKEKLKFGSGSITKQVKKQNIFGVRQKFEASPGLWRTENIREFSSRPTFKRRAPTTPRGPFARTVTHRPVELQMYQKILDHSSDYADLINLTRRPTSPNRSPIFSRSPAIQRSYLKDQNESQLIREQMEKYQRRKKKPEVITLEDRPKIYESAKDKDVIEIIDVVSPPKSPSKKKVLPKSQNSLAREFELHDICSPDYLQQLKDKYDRRKGNF